MGIFQRGKFFGRWEFSKGANFLVDGNFKFLVNGNFLKGVDGNFPKGQFFEFSKAAIYW